MRDLHPVEMLLLAVVLVAAVLAELLLGPPPPPLESLTVVELRQRARAAGLRDLARSGRKAALIAALR